MAYARNDTNLENWDPMAQSYRDAQINSYGDGPGMHLTPHIGPSPNGEYKLYVGDIPAELNESGLRSVFNQYGTTTGVLHLSGTSWGFVTYSSFREAEEAIRVLNRKPPMNMSVTFSKNKEERLDRRQGPRPYVGPIPQVVSAENLPRQYIEPEQRPQIHRPFVRNSAPGHQPLDVARRTLTAHQGMAIQQEMMSNGRVVGIPYPAHDPHVYNAYEEPEPFPETNNMWARGKLQITRDGNRYVSMGRGYSCCYELPTRHPKVNQQIRDVYEKRQAGLYEYGNPKFTQQVGKCQNCAKAATMRCQRCREFYCGRPCQEEDWSRHRIECQITMPPLEGGGNSGSISISSGEEMTQHQEPKKRSIRKMRRPMKPGTPSATQNPNSTFASVTTPPAEMARTTLDGIPDLQGQENEFVVPQDKLKRSISGDQKRDSDHNSSAIKGSWTPLKNGGDHKPLRDCNTQGETVTEPRRPDFMNHPPPPFVRQNQEAKQERNSDEKNFTSQNSAGNNKGNDIQQQGSNINRNLFKRGARENSDQHNKQIREQIKNINIQDTKPPQSEPKPKLILNEPDLGFYKASEMPGPSHVKSPPKVPFHEKKADGAKAGPSGIGTPKQPKQEMDNVVELLGAEEVGCFEVNVPLGENKAAVTVCFRKIQEDYDKIVRTLTTDCDKTMDALLFNPKVGDLVCGKRQDDWIRGTVVSLGPPKRVAAIDEGRVDQVTHLKPIPEGYKTVPALGAICEITQGDVKLVPMEPYTFVVVNNNLGKVHTDGVEVIVFDEAKNRSLGILKPWTPSPEQKGVPYATLTNGTEVYLVSFRSHVLICARSLVPKNMELFNRVTQDVAHWSTQASPKTVPPIGGEMVIAKYEEDGNFYRAIVRKVEGKKITVSYVDFGNIETTVLENILPISDKLKEYPSCVAKIVLKDVPKDIPMTKEVSEYLGELAGRETPLMCTFEESPQEGVILKKADGTVINDKVIELLTPGWKKPEEAKDKTKVYTLEDLEIAELGKVGETIRVVLLFSYGPLLHAMAPQDFELISHVTEVMPGQMEAYATQIKDHYIPRENELCVAPYTGAWYRAVCLEPYTTPTASSVNFLDFGNVEVIEHVDVRAMTNDFVTAKTLASLCTVVGLGPLDNDGNLPAAVASRVTELIPVNDITLIKIVECTKSGEYTIELPEVKETLVKEGLLKL